MIELLRELFGPNYQSIKFIHLFVVMIWGFSAAHAYLYYVVPVFKAWRRSPEDKEIVELRNWVIERFDQGVILEHIAFPLVIVTGILLYLVGGWSTANTWLTLKLSIVFLIMIPIESLDCYLSHFGGNKAQLRLSGDMEHYETMVNTHWLFLVVTSPVILVFVTGILFLAVMKPF